MKSLIYYIDRWNSTQTPYLIKNVISAICIFALTCFAVKSGAFEEYTATRACLFAVLMCNIWSGTFNSIALFYSESEYITDDLNKFLSVSTYVVANLLIQLFLCIVEALACTVIFKLFYNYETAGIALDNRNIEYSITFFLILISADMLGFLVGMLIKNITSAMSIIPIILIIQFLFSGCLFELEGILRTFAKFTTAKWGFAALGAITNLNSYLPSDTKNELFEYSSTHVIYCWKQLFLLAVVCFVGSGILLYGRINKYDK